MEGEAGLNIEEDAQLSNRRKSILEGFWLLTPFNETGSESPVKNNAKIHMLMSK